MDDVVIEEVIFPTKAELLQTMVMNYNRQKELCDDLYDDAYKSLKSPSTNDEGSRRTKKENTALKEYNSQVRAIGDTIAKMLQIQKSEAPRKEEQEEELISANEELV